MIRNGEKITICFLVIIFVSFILFSLYPELPEPGKVKVSCQQDCVARLNFTGLIGKIFFVL